jgi:hypothetical protein
MKKFEKLDDRAFEKLDEEKKKGVKGGYYTAYSIMTYDPYSPSPTGPVIASEPSLQVSEDATMGSRLDTTYVWDGGSGGGWA